MATAPAPPMCTSLPPCCLLCYENKVLVCAIETCDIIKGSPNGHGHVRGTVPVKFLPPVWEPGTPTVETRLFIHSHISGLDYPTQSIFSITIPDNFCTFIFWTAQEQFVVHYLAQGSNHWPFNKMDRIDRMTVLPLSHCPLMLWPYYHPITQDLIWYWFWFWNVVQKKQIKVKLHLQI